MKTVVLLNELTSSDVINKDTYNQYVGLLKKDIRKMLIESNVLVDIPCPGCGEDKCRQEFDKWGMTYKDCQGCDSVYVSPRPSPASINEFYRDSPACQFWRKEMFSMKDDQLYYIYGPKMNWIANLADEQALGQGLLVDYGTKFPFLLTAIANEHIFKGIGYIAPQLYESGHLVSETFLKESRIKDSAHPVTLLTAFETIERMADPADFFKTASTAVSPGGLLLFTTASCSGFEYTVLGQHAPNFNPINRMNLLSMNALEAMVDKAGFDVIEFSTPGRLDVDIVRRTLKENPNIDVGSFWRFIFESRDEKTWQNLQNFLQENRLSSHVRIAARKRKNNININD